MIENTYKNILIRATPGLHEKVFSLIRSIKESGSVMDLGAGQGALTERLSDAGYSVTAVDVNSVDFSAKNYFRHLILDFNNIEQVNLFMKEHANLYDFVLGIEVIEHVENPWAYIRQITGLVKSGGFVVITTPNCSSWHSRLRFLLHGVYDEFSEIAQEGHINPITPWELRMIMEKCGLKDVKIHEAGMIYSSPTLFQRLAFLCGLIIRPFQKGQLDGYCIVATGVAK